MAAADGSGRLVLLLGEAGMGKTTTARDAAAAARRAGVIVRWSACWSGGGTVAHAPWLTLLSGLGPAGRDALESLLGSEGGDAGDAAAAGAVRSRAYAAVVDALEDSTTERPALLVLDDLHWADEGTLQLLDVVAAHLPALPVVVVGTYRPTDVRPRLTTHPARRGRRPGGAPGARTRQGWPASSEPTSAPGGPPSLAAEVGRLTAGNPFLVVQLGRLLADDAGVLAAAALPTGARDLLEQRLAALAPDERELLAAAAVLDSPFRAVDLAWVLGRDATTIEAGLARAAALRIVERAPGTGAWAFVHDLFRRAALEAADPLAIRDFHLRAAEALEAADAEAAVVAAHLLEVGGGHAGAAAQWSIRAGDRAIAALAWEEAAAHYERALSAIAGARPRPAGGSPRRARAGPAAARRRDGSHPRLRRAGGAGSGARCGRARRPCRPGLERRSVGVRGPPVRPAPDRPPRGSGPGPGKAWTRRRRACGPRSWPACPWPCRSWPRMTAVSPSPRRPSPSPVPPRTRSCWLVRWPPTATPSPVPTAARTARRRRARSSPSPKRPATASSNCWAGGCASWRGSSRATSGASRRTWRHSPVGPRRSATRSTSGTCRCGRRSRRWWPVTPRPALAGAADVQALGAASGSTNAPVLALVIRLMAYMVQGDHETPIELLAEMGREAPNLAQYVSALGAFALANHRAGRDTEARAHLDRAQALGLDAVPFDAEWLANLTSLVEAAAAVGHPMLEDAVDRLVPWAHRVSFEGIGAGLYGSAARHAALGCSALGRHDEAVRHAESALVVNRRFGGALLAHALRTLGDVTEARDGRTSRAATLHASADDAYAALGLHHLVGGDAGRGVDDEAGARSRAAAAPEARNELRRAGEVWHVAYGGTEVVLRHSKGLMDLAMLLARPDVEVHVTDLEGVPHELTAGSGGEALDRRAMAAYKERLAELAEELDEAEVAHDLGRAELARTEYDAVLDQLASAVGLGGRSRAAGPEPIERLRKAVSARLRDAIRRIDGVHPALGRHLANAVRTGVYCVYRPDQAGPGAGAHRPGHHGRPSLRAPHRRLAERPAAGRGAGTVLPGPGAGRPVRGSGGALDAGRPRRGRRLRGRLLVDRGDAAVVDLRADRLGAFGALTLALQAVAWTAGSGLALALAAFGFAPFVLPAHARRAAAARRARVGPAPADGRRGDAGPDRVPGSPPGSDRASRVRSPRSPSRPPSCSRSPTPSRARRRRWDSCARSCPRCGASRSSARCSRGV